MLIQTLLKPRLDGTVTAEFGKEKYVFKSNADGDLVCEVKEQTHLEQILLNSNFQPYEVDDFEQADKILESLESKTNDSDDFEEDETVNMDAMPVEGVAAKEAEVVEMPTTKTKRGKKKA